MDVLEHGNRYLAREGALRLPIHVLRADLNGLMVELEHRVDRLQIDGGRANEHVHGVGPMLVEVVGDGLRQHHGLGIGVVHLPVSCHKRFAGHEARSFQNDKGDACAPLGLP